MDPMPARRCLRLRACVRACCWPPAQSGWVAFAVCFPVIICGLLSTMILLALLHKPLPALPFSMLFGPFAFRPPTPAVASRPSRIASRRVALTWRGSSDAAPRMSRVVFVPPA